MRLCSAHQVEAFVWLRYDQQITSRPVRAYRGRAAGLKEDRQATVEVQVDEEALESAVVAVGLAGVWDQSTR